MEGYKARMSTDDLRELFDDRVAGVLATQGFIAPIAPRSIYRVEKLYTALNKYAPRNAFNPLRTIDLKAGFAFARTCFMKPKDVDFLKPLPLDESGVQTLTKNWSGSAGLTNFGYSKRESTGPALQKARRILNHELAPEPCVAFKRTQFNDKTRLVWGYPYSMTILEGLLAQPLINEMKKGQTPMAFAMPVGVLGTKLRVSSYNKEWAYSLDMSSFDSSVSSVLIRKAFQILSTWFDPNYLIQPGCTVTELLDRIEHYFIFTPIVMPDGCCYRGKQHGVPSGSYFTQLIDSVVNCIIAGAISSHFHLGIRRRHTFVLGDDLLIWSNHKVSLDAISSFALRTLGIHVHGSEKSALTHFDQPVHFLGREWHGGVPSLDVDSILARMVYPESFRHYSDDPEKARKQVKILLLSYAAVYLDAWKIVLDIYGDCDTNIRSSEQIECDVYEQGVLEDILKERGETLSGYLRFRARYLDLNKDTSITSTALQFWL